MLGLETMVRNAGETVYGVVSDHGPWMVWNTILAVVPLVLALALFRSGCRRSVGWWCGVVAFVAFLPNAPYVLSDVIHFFDDVRAFGSPVASWRFEHDRARAIDSAIHAAVPGDVVLVAGKGHEKYQEIRGTRRYFDDVEAVDASLRRRAA